MQGSCVALDRDNKLYTWSVQKRFHSTDLLELAQAPTIVKTLRKKTIQAVFPGYNSIFALSDDVLVQPNPSQGKEDKLNYKQNPPLQKTISQDLGIRLGSQQSFEPNNVVNI